MTPEELDFGDSNYADDSIKVIAKLKEEITQANHRYADLQNVCDDQAEEIKRLKAESDDLLVRHERLTRAIKLLAIETEKQGSEVQRQIAIRDARQLRR